VSVVGTFLAAIIIALMNNGLILIQADPYWVQFLLGVLILGAVGLGQVRVVWKARARARVRRGYV
jgi:ribose transport system permease protein